MTTEAIVDSLPNIEENDVIAERMGNFHHTQLLADDDDEERKKEVQLRVDDDDGDRETNRKKKKGAIVQASRLPINSTGIGIEGKFEKLIDWNGIDRLILILIKNTHLIEHHTSTF